VVLFGAEYSKEAVSDHSDFVERKPLSLPLKSISSWSMTIFRKNFFAHSRNKLFRNKLDKNKTQNILAQNNQSY
jgi:hypothetical protein